MIAWVIHLLGFMVMSVPVGVAFWKRHPHRFIIILVGALLTASPVPWVVGAAMAFQQTQGEAHVQVFGKVVSDVASLAAVGSFVWAVLTWSEVGAVLVRALH